MANKPLVLVSSHRLGSKENSTWIGTHHYFSTNPVIMTLVAITVLVVGQGIGAYFAEFLSLLILIWIVFAVVLGLAT